MLVLPDFLLAPTDYIYSNSTDNRRDKTDQQLLGFIQIIDNERDLSQPRRFRRSASVSK